VAGDFGDGERRRDVTGGVANNQRQASGHQEAVW
jgi:hypothetical protein